MKQSRSLDKDTLRTLLNVAHAEPTIQQLEFVSISMDPEARLRLWLAPLSAYAHLASFVIAALREWQREMQAPAETLDEFIDQSLWLPGTAEDRQQMLRHVDYAFAPELVATLTEDIVDGLRLYDQWNIQAAIYVTKQHYLFFFWMTYV